MPRTIFEKICDSHVVHEQDGNYIICVYFYFCRSFIHNRFHT